MDKHLELRQSQHAVILNGGTRMPVGMIPCMCGAKPGMLHNWGCGNERCPVCHATKCGCSHD